MLGRTDNKGNNKGTARNLKPVPNKGAKGKKSDSVKQAGKKVVKSSLTTVDNSSDKRSIKEMRKTGFSKNALKSRNALVRIEAYRYLGYTNKALNDESTEIRLEAYRVLGYTKKAFNDSDPMIRLNAYRELGYDKKALKDNYPVIRKTANLLL